MHIASLVILSTLAGFSAFMATAQEPRASAPDLSGTWKITVQDPGCSFGGQAAVRPSETGYTANLVMRHDCPFFPEGPITAVQESTISISGAQVSVRSTIIEFPSTDWSNSYAPDHFALTATSDIRLFGIQSDIYGTRPAEWVREESGIS